MKFGKTFISHQVPEWSPHYMKYKELKKQIKIVVSKQKQWNKESDSEGKNLDNEAVQASLADFFFKIDRNIEKVDTFYNFQFLEYERRLRKISLIVESNVSKDGSKETGEFDKDELEEVIGILIEERSSFRNLKWFGELNKRGFIKILKKLDKKTGSTRQSSFLNTRIFPLGFANECEILKILNHINILLGKLLTDAKTLGIDMAAAASSGPQNQESSSTKYMKYISGDDGNGLFEHLTSDFKSCSLVPLKLSVTLLNKAALLHSYSCIDVILKQIQDLNGTGDISGRNFFHHHVIALGKQYVKNEEIKKKVKGVTIERDFSIIPAAAPEPTSRLIGAYGSDGISSSDSTKGLDYILSKLPVFLRPNLLQRDNYRRTPLHYSAQFGLKSVTGLIIEYLKKWSQWDANVSIDNIEVWGDTEKLTPLHLSLVGDHPKTTDVLLHSMNPDVTLCNPSLILLAARLNSPKLLESLLSCKGIDIDYFKNDTKETALYIATKMNSFESVEYLLTRGANTEISELIFGWTPIFIAAAEGFEESVQLLIDKGAEYSQVDESGWLPMEHASLRGHLKLAEKIRPANYDALKLAKSSNINNLLTSHDGSSLKEKMNDHNSTSSIDKLPRKGEKYKEMKTGEAISLAAAPGLSDGSSSPPNVNGKPPGFYGAATKSFGHQFLSQNQSLVIITLGTTDLRDTTPAINLNRVPLSKAHLTELDTALSLSISCKQLAQPPVLLDLPLDDDHGSANDTISFKFTDQDPLDATIYFDIVPTYSYPREQENKVNGVLGRAILIMANAYTNVGKDRRSLNNVITIPIMEADTLEELGTIRFEIIHVTSFVHPDLSFNINESYWKKLITTRVIGHRGLGKNFDTKNSLQLGENTVESFIAAASLGASYVEFDVQLTKDHVPVIYHDFLVAETGVDIPMHQLTAEQFLKLSGNEEKESGKLRGRSLSLSGDSTDFQEQAKVDNFNSLFTDRMKLTRTFKEKQFKGNSRGHSIASSFVTLEDLFKKLPENVGFNVECKYPMLDEAQMEDMEQIVVSLNTWVDTVLTTVCDHKGLRNIIFSSFHPDICVLLSLKQPSIPILFLTEGGTAAMADARASSLQAAIRFAKKWNLLGIVSAAEPIVQCPRLASVVKSNGLVCFTYGVLNNDPKNSRLEVEAGVDAVIVDKVLAVRKGLYDDGA